MPAIPAIDSGHRDPNAQQPKQLAHAISERWSMELVAYAMFEGGKLCVLTVVDLFTRERLAVDVGQSLKGEDVVRVLTATFGKLSGLATKSFSLVSSSVTTA